MDGPGIGDVHVAGPVWPAPGKIVAARRRRKAGALVLKHVAGSPLTQAEVDQRSAAGHNHRGLGLSRPASDPAHRYAHLAGFAGGVLGGVAGSLVGGGLLSFGTGVAGGALGQLLAERAAYATMGQRGTFGQRFARGPYSMRANPRRDLAVGLGGTAAGLVAQHATQGLPVLPRLGLMVAGETAGTLAPFFAFRKDLSQAQHDERVAAGQASGQARHHNGASPGEGLSRFLPSRGSLITGALAALTAGGVGALMLLGRGRGRPAAAWRATRVLSGLSQRELEHGSGRADAMQFIGSQLSRRSTPELMGTKQRLTSQLQTAANEMNQLRAKGERLKGSGPLVWQGGQRVKATGLGQEDGIRLGELKRHHELMSTALNGVSQELSTRAKGQLGAGAARFQDEAASLRQQLSARAKGQGLQDPKSAWTYDPATGKARDGGSLFNRATTKGVPVDVRTPEEIVAARETLRRGR